jgi:hypothetical protein
MLLGAIALPEPLQARRQQWRRYVQRCRKATLSFEAGDAAVGEAGDVAGFLVCVQGRSPFREQEGANYF